MNEPRPAASLTGNLLARKGAARPAIRPSYVYTETPLVVEKAAVPAHSDRIDVLDAKTSASAPMAGEAEGPIQPTSAQPERAAYQDKLDIFSSSSLKAGKSALDAPMPDTMDAAEAMPKPKRPAARPAAPRRASAGKGPRAKTAAFTLRLDERRHYALRLAAAHLNESGQKLLIDALDRLLVDLAPSLPENCACVDATRADPA